MMRFLTAGGVAVCLLAAAVVVCAKPGTVQLKDGHQINGDVNEKGDDVVITNNKVDTVVKKSNVDRIDYYDSIPDQFHARLKKLKKDDAKGRYDLARWAFDNHEYELSRLALREAVEIDPNYAQAVEFNEQVRRQMELEKKSHGDEEAATREAAASQPTNGEHTLTAADINIIRQKEIKSTDTNVRIRFENDVERRFANAMSVDPGRFRNLKPLDKFLEIQRQNDPVFLQDVKILNDPQVVMDYKKEVQRAILAGCASSGCHGGPNGGRFVLISPADNDTSAYTNFYILQTYMQKAKDTPGGNKKKKAADDGGGIFGGGSAEHPMISRFRPDESILLNYGLPAEQSEFDHPDVPNYRGLFKNRNDPRYRQIREWITTLKSVDPDYGIDFKPTVGRGPASAPRADAGARARRSDTTGDTAVSERTHVGSNSSASSPRTAPVGSDPQGRRQTPLGALEAS